MATNIPPHNLREVIDATIAFIDNPAIDARRADEHIKGPDFPTGGIILGRARASATPTRPAAAACACAAKAHIEPLSQGKEAIIVTELPYQVKKGGDGGLITEDRRPRPRQEDPRDLRPARRVRPQRHAPRDRAQARRDPEGRAQQALQAHADADDVRREHGRARRRRAAHARRCARCSTNYVAHQREVIVRRTKHELGAEGGPRPHPRGPAHRARQPRRGHRADPRLARPRRRPRRADRALRAQRRSRRRRSSTCASPQLTALEADAIKQEHADVTERIARAARDPRRRGARARASSRRSCSRSRERFGDERRTEITPSEDEIDIEDLIADQQMVITITHSPATSSRCRWRPTASSSAAGAASPGWT